jgi:streptogramin lyase
MIVKTSLLLSLLCLAGISANAQMHRGRNTRATPVAIVSNQNNPAAIAVDETSVYWVSDSRSTINKMSKAGGALTTLVSGQKKIHRIIVDEDQIYFNTDDEVRRVNKTGGTPTTLATIADIAYFDLAVDEMSVYYVSSPSSRSRLMKVSKGGGDPVTLVSNDCCPGGLAADGANVYWADFGDDTLKKMDINGGAIATIGTCNQPHAVAVDASSVYCTGFGEIVRFRKTDGVLITRIGGKNPLDDFDRIALDEKNVYVIGVKGIYRVSKNGGEPALLVPQHLESSNFAVGATSIYWTNYWQGTVMRLRK